MYRQSSVKTRSNKKTSSNNTFHPFYNNQSQLYTTNLMYILNFKDPPSFLIQSNVSLYRCLNQGPSDLETDDIPMFHPAPLTWIIYFIIGFRLCWLLLSLTLYCVGLFYPCWTSKKHELAILLISSYSFDSNICPQC